jgi:DNA topoisomerase-1
MTIEIEATVPKSKDGYLLKAASSSLRFLGFTTVYSEGKDESDKKEMPTSLPELEAGDRLRYIAAFPEQHFTQPPARYTEATLIKALEQEGIGRPSTYAPILTTIQERQYVHKLDGRFHPDELGIVVNDILCQHFPKIVENKFTAQMEQNLDEIAQGKEDWVAVLHAFYFPFEDMLQHASANMTKVKVVEMTEQKCPNCDRPMVIRVGRFGKFLACSGYPECKTTMPFLVKTGVLCPQCGGELVRRIGKHKKVFYGCSNYPKCQFITNSKPIPQPCPQCGKLLVAYKEDEAKCVACRCTVKLSELNINKEKVEVTS